MNKQIIYIIVLFSFQTLVGKNKEFYLEKPSESINYCSKLKKVKSLEGTFVKIWHNEGIYNTLNGQIMKLKQKLEKNIGKNLNRKLEILAR